MPELRDLTELLNWATIELRLYKEPEERLELEVIELVRSEDVPGTELEYLLV